MKIKILIIAFTFLLSVISINQHQLVDNQQKNNQLSSNYIATRKHLNLHAQETQISSNTPSIKKHDQTQINSLNQSNQTTSKQNLSFGDCAQNIWRTSVVGGLISGGTTAGVRALSTAGISAAGFGAGGVVAGSTAAVVQSGIGIVSTGSFFASLQSAGALGLGLLGTYALPITVGVGLVTGGGYLMYQCYQTIGN